MTGPPSWICFLKRGMTLPREPRTLPNRTAQKRVFDFLESVWTTISAALLVAPMMLTGFTALSVEISKKRLELWRSAASAKFLVPKMLFWMASSRLHSISGTCLWAAAWKITVGL